MSEAETTLNRAGADSGSHDANAHSDGRAHDEAHPGADEELCLLADSARDFAMIFTDPDRNVVRWSKGAEAVLGWTQEEATGKREIDLIFTPEDKATGVPRQEQETALREGRAEDERWHMKKDGTRFWATGVMTPLYDPDTKQLRGFGKVLRDMTAQKRLEEALRASAEARAFLAAIVESSQDSIVTVDFDGVITSWNRAAEELYGYRAGEAIGKSLSMLALPEDLAMIAEKIDEVRNSLEVATFDTVRCRKGGDHIHLEIVMSPVRDAGGIVIGVSTLARDVTERRQAAQELEERVAERTAALQAALAERKALTGRVVRAQEEERRRISRDLHDSTGQYMAALAMELGQMEESAAKTRLAAYTAAERSAAAARLATEAAREAEDAANKAAAVGTARSPDAKRSAASGAGEEAAHLSVAAAEVSRKAAIAGADAASAAAAAQAAVTMADEAAPRVARLKSVTASLSRDVHGLAVALRPTSLDDLGLVPALTALCEEWAERTRVAPEFVATGMDKERLPPAVETVVYRVVQEALTNAAKYAVPAGHTKINVTLQRFGDQVSATVEDDGPGFDLEEAAKKGRLGLSGMQERAELAGGTLEIESEPGQGTTVFLRVPVSQT